MYAQPLLDLIKSRISPDSDTLLELTTRISYKEGEILELGSYECPVGVVCSVREIVNLDVSACRAYHIRATFNSGELERWLKRIETFKSGHEWQTCPHCLWDCYRALTECTSCYKPLKGESE